MLFTQPAPSVAPTSPNNGGVINNPTELQTVQTFSSLNQRGNKLVFLSTAIVGVWSPLLKSYVRDFLIVPRITDFVPSIQPNLKTKRFKDINRSILSDPSFDVPGKIDMIIGAELFYQILKDGRKAISDNVSLINTVFGFIVCGSISEINNKSSCFLTSENIDNCIKKFWEIEEIIQDRHLSKEEEFCEMHFRNTHRRDCTGRFIVNMPVQDEELTTL
ncbi:integrase catalytic domain-containing protein, partial [Trichonephila clavata]